MTQVTELTPEQIVLMAKVRDRWLKIGLDTSPIDEAKAKRAVRKTYRCAGLKPPRKFIFYDSPIQGWLAVAMANLCENKVRGQVGVRVGDRVWGQVRGQVGVQIGVQIGDRVWGQVRGQVRDQVWDQVGVQVWDQVGVQVGDRVWDQVLYGQHDAGWLSFYQFFHEAGIVDCSKFEGLWACAEQCGWWWGFKDVAVITGKPSAVHRDTQNRLHCSTGMAIQYRDGWGLYRWHGVAVSEDVILHPELITTHDIEQEQNQEVRRVLIERYGEARYLEDSSATMVQEDHFGKLYSKEIPGDETIVMVRVMNSTPEPDGHHKPYWLRVPPGVKTAHEAVAWTFGLTPEQYQPEQES